jgi:hypothetical protein
LFTPKYRKKAGIDPLLTSRSGYPIAPFDPADEVALHRLTREGHANHRPGPKLQIARGELGLESMIAKLDRSVY